MTLHKRKKLNLNVNRTFQKWLYVRILGSIILSSLVAALILYFYARNEIATTFYDAHIKIRRVSDLLLPVVAAGSSISLISGLILSLFIPQKIAGPIFRIQQDLKPVQDGDLTSLISLRDEDVLKDLAEDVNKATYETRLKVQKSQAALEALIEVMEPTAENSVLQERIEVLQKTLSQFKTK